MEFSNKFIEDLNAALQCNPDYCRKAGCPLYFAEVDCCDVDRFLNTFNVKMKIKFENIKKYDPFDC